MKTKFGKLFGIRQIIDELRLYNALLQDKRTPIFAKFLLVIAFLYLVMPLDFLPDIIPLAGWIDDIIIVPSITKIATSFVPEPLLRSVKKSLKK